MVNATASEKGAEQRDSKRKKSANMCSFSGIFKIRRPGVVSTSAGKRRISERVTTKFSNVLVDSVVEKEFSCDVLKPRVEKSFQINPLRAAEHSNEEETPPIPYSDNANKIIDCAMKNEKVLVHCPQCQSMGNMAGMATL